MTRNEMLKIEIKEYEKLRNLYEVDIAKGERGEEIDYNKLRQAEIAALDKIISAMQITPYSIEWTKYTNNPILDAMDREISQIPCPDYTRYYGVRKQEAENVSI